MTHLNISFIVPLFNQLKQTQAMLATLQATIPSGLRYEIILVDDASTDGTRQWLSDLSLPNLRVVLNPVNLGFAKANHAGIKVANGEVLALLNNDLLLTPGWLEPMLEVLVNPYLNAGIVGNVQNRVFDSALDHAGVQISDSGQLVHVQVLPGSSVAYERVFAVTGACCLVRRDVFNAVGGFDEFFLNGCEDIDLCFKVKALGLHIYMAYRSVIQHHVSLSRDVTSLQNEINSRILYQKWRLLLKRELVRNLYKALQAHGHGAPGENFYGLLPSIISTPYTAAQVLAESKLLRIEAQFVRLLDKIDPNEGIEEVCRCVNLSRNSEDTFFQLLKSSLNVLIESPKGLSGFYISGNQRNPPEGVQTKITLTINGIQEKTFVLGAASNFNIGMSHPVVLPEVTNCVDVYFSSHVSDALKGSRLYIDPCSFITISHMVIDGAVINRFIGSY